MFSGDKYSHSLSKLPHKYNMLGVFHVVDAVPELNGRRIRYRVRLQKRFLAEKSWWAPQGSPMPPATRLYAQRALVQACTTCHKASSQVYAPGWKCLNPECADFRFLNGVAVTSSLAINPAYISERTDFLTAPRMSMAVVPSLPINDPTIPFCSYTRERGIVCPKCNGCNSRISWQDWACQTPGCDLMYEINISRSLPPIYAIASISNVLGTLCLWTLPSFLRLNALR